MYPEEEQINCKGMNENVCSGLLDFDFQFVHRTDTNDFHRHEPEPIVDNHFLVNNIENKSHSLHFD